MLPHDVIIQLVLQNSITRGSFFFFHLKKSDFCERTGIDAQYFLWHVYKYRPTSCVEWGVGVGGCGLEGMCFLPLSL